MAETSPPAPERTPEVATAACVTPQAATTAEADGPREAIDDPHRLARLYLAEHGTYDRQQALYWHRDEWHRYDGGAYATIPASEIRAELTANTKAEFDRAARAEWDSWQDGDNKQAEPPTVRKVTGTLQANVLRALESECILPGKVEPPAWLDDDPPWPARETLVTQTGLLHLPSLIGGRPSLMQPTPVYFGRNALAYGFNPDAECPQWLGFLQTLWADDPESVQTLREWFGYCLLPDTAQHKLLMLIGPPRSGKGTIGRILSAMIGRDNITSPTLASLAGPFGLWPLVGKLVALIADARLSGRTDAVAVVERLLSISGEDPQDVHRKNLPTLTGIHLPVRFVVMTNELPNMRDASGALTTRVLLLRLSESFSGREDRTIGKRLLTELPGILKWSIDGWQSLQSRGYFRQPATGQELLDDLTDLASPIGAFVRDRCRIGPEYSARVDELFSTWQDWCKEHGRDHPGTRETFGRDLRAALSGLRVSNIRDSGGRVRVYVGIGRQ